MEILLLIAIIIVAASGLYVAFTLNNRIKGIGQIITTGATTDELGQLKTDPRQELRSESSSQVESLVLAMLEAESHVDSKGWGEPPRLYALTKQTSSIDTSHELATEMRDARPAALIPVEREPLPHGNLIEVLASIHWQEDVVGCVLVAERAASPLRGEEGAFVDPTAGQWACMDPDGRPARLAVGVCRNLEYTCGLRIKGDEGVQIRTELAEDLVTALLATFQRRI